MTDRKLHTREVAGSKPAAPITIPAALVDVVEVKDGCVLVWLRLGSEQGGSRWPGEDEYPDSRISLDDFSYRGGAMDRGRP